MQDKLCSDIERSHRIQISELGYVEADCISDTHVIEIDWNFKWREGIGQSLIYSKLTDLRPGLILVCKESDVKSHLCYGHSLMAQSVFSKMGVEATIWQCVEDSPNLESCVRRELSE